MGNGTDIVTCDAQLMGIAEFAGRGIWSGALARGDRDHSICCGDGRNMDHEDAELCGRADHGAVLRSADWPGSDAG